MFCRGEMSGFHFALMVSFWKSALGFLNLALAKEDLRALEFRLEERAFLLRPCFVIAAY